MNRFVFAAVLVCAASAHAQATAYFTAIPDLPVATGLVEAAAPAPPTFDAERVRLMFAEARGATSVEAVRAFYVESLSALGWAREPSLNPEDTVFIRGRERLFLLVGERDGETVLRVRLIQNNAVMTAD